MGNKLMHKMFALFISAAILFAVFPVTAFKVNASATAPQSVSIDTSINGYLSSSSALNEYYFTLPSAGSIIIQFTTPLSHSTESWRVTLYDTSRSLTLQTKNRGASYTFTSANTKTEVGEKVRLPAGSTYRIDISCASNTVYSSVSYTFMIKFIPEDSGYELEHNNTISEATPLDLNTYISGNIGYSADTDYYKITLPSHGSLNIYFSVSSIIDTGNWAVLLYDKNERQLQMMRTGYGGTIASAQRISKLNKIRLPAGTYYIKITPYVDTDISYADYAVIAAFTPETSNAYAKAFNNTRESATKIALNGAVTGNLSNPGDINYFAFEVAKEDDIKIILETPDKITQNMWSIYLLNDKGGITTYYAGQSGNIVDGKKFFTSDVITLDAGKYYVAIYPFSSNSYSNEDFTLTVHSDTAPIPEIVDENGKTETEIYSSTEIPVNTYGVNKSLQGQIKSHSDVNIFEFGLTNNGSISLSFQLPGATSRQMWIANIYDKNDNLLYTDKFGDGTAINSRLRTETSDRIRLSAGSYYVQILPVDAYNYSSEAYSLTIVYADESRSTLLSGQDTNYSIYEREFNNTSHMANVLDIGNCATGNMSTPADVDNFKVVLKDGGSFRFSFSTPKTVTQNNWVLKLYTSDMKLLYEDTFGADGMTDATDKLNNEFKSELSSKIRLPEGTYYICVEAYNSINYSNEDYKLQVIFTPETSDDYAQAFNNTPETANSIQFNKDKTGNLSSSTDVNYYTFTVKEAISIQIKFSIDMQIKGSYWYVKLFDSQLKEFKSYKIGGVGSVTPEGIRYFKTEIIQVVPGEYYIAVGTYSAKEYSNEDYMIKLLNEAGRKIDVYSYVADKPSAWAMSEVNFAYAYDLVPSGYMKDFTSPITREEFCTLVVKLITAVENKQIEEVLANKKASVDYDAFTDTNEYVVLAAHALGIIKGRGSGIFDPNGKITREEAAIMLMRVGTLLNISTNSSSLNFGDKIDFQTDAVSAINYVSGCMDDKNNRVMNGYEDGKFHPKDMYSREQAYMTILRLYSCR